jgi:dihydrolipoamide dehydrogenase
MPEIERFDVVIIGSGPGGYVAAIRAGQLGLKVAIVERDPKFGGTCLHRGCIPAKALLHAAHLMHQIEHAEEFGIEVKGARLNLEKVQAYKDRVVNRMAIGVQSLLKKNKVTMVQGTGKLRGSKQVEVAGKEPRLLEGRFVLLAAGSAPRTLPNLSLDGKSILCSDDIWTMTQVPKSILIVGGGAIGVECATTFHRFGSEVTLVELLPNLVPLEDEEISAELKKSFTKQGIKSLTQTKVAALEKTRDGVQVRLESTDGKGSEVKVERVLVAVGRGPQTSGLGLEGTRVELDRGYVKVDSYMRTAEPGVYAIGDIVPTPQLAHVASAEGIVAVEHMAGRQPRPLNYDRTPNCTFCDPQIASIGLTEKKARERGAQLKVSKFPWMAIGKSVILGVTEGFTKVVADARYGEILGVHIIHPYASHLIGEAVAAINGEIPAEELARAVHPHPTLSEGIMEAMHGIGGLPIHI